LLNRGYIIPAARKQYTFQGKHGVDRSVRVRSQIWLAESWVINRTSHDRSADGGTVLRISAAGRVSDAAPSPKANTPANMTDDMGIFQEAI
jgi:hypothetical protein